MACTSPEVQLNPRMEAATTIDSLESVLKSAEGELNEELAEQMVNEYQAYVETYPEDSASVYYAYKAGDISMNRDGKELYAISFYATVFEDYPEHSLAGQALFMTGMAFDKLNDKERSIATFEHFIESYPYHPWVPEAEQMIALQSEVDDLDVQVDQWLEKANSEN